ncbi:MAG TPA: Rieske (2Fe-2S) protein [Natronosporangium sp.]|nr:Rieske (2Fe-2S) protein [Natronosporangium sp.]
MQKEPMRAPRRAVLTGVAGVAGVSVVGAGAAGVLAGCQASETPVGGRDRRDDGGAAPAGDGERADAAGAPVASTADVAVGGGLILPDQDLVVTQPTEGEFKGFRATCTHLGCKVESISDGKIICPCHNSEFSIVDGSVVRAADGLTPDQQDPLPAAPIAVEGEDILLA